MAKFFLPFIGLVTFLILFGVFLILGLIQHDKNKILVSILSFMLAITCAVFFALNIGKKLNSLLPNHITTDPGEVYSSQFGYLEDSCVFVKHAEAENFPHRVWLEFNACPAAVQKITRNSSYHQVLVQVSDTGYFPSSPIVPLWWLPSTLGNDAIVLENLKNKNGLRELLVINRDSSRAFYCELTGLDR